MDEQEMIQIDLSAVRRSSTKSKRRGGGAESAFSSVSTHQQVRRDSPSPETASLLSVDDRASYTSVPLNTPSHRAKRWERSEKVRIGRFLNDHEDDEDEEEDLEEGVAEKEVEDEEKGNSFSVRRKKKKKKKKKQRRDSGSVRDWKEGYDTAKREWESENSDSIMMKLCGCCAFFIDSYLTGVAPGLLRLFDDFVVLDFFINVLLRSVGQVAFCDNPWSGVLIIIACFVDFDNMAGPCLYGLTCVCVANLTAFFLNIDKGLIRHGLFGFNAFLIGIGVSVFLETTKHDWTPDYPVMFGVVSCGIAGVFVQLAISKIVGTFGPIPCLTLPFNLMLILFLFDAERQFSVRSVNPMFINPSQISIVSAPANQTNFVGENLPEGLMKGLSEIFVINDTAASVLILIAMLLYSRIAAGLALTGSMIGLLSSVALGSNNGNVKIGLWGYNPALTMMALGGVFTVPSFDSVVLAALASFLTQIIWAGLVQFFAPWGLPVCTLPFCFATFAFMLIRPEVSSRFKYIPLADVTTPEDHYRKFK